MLGKGQTLEFLASEEAASCSIWLYACGQPSSGCAKPTKVSKKVREMVQRDQTEGKGRQKGKGRLKALKAW